jgi:hypothetical protein
MGCEFDMKLNRKSSGDSQMNDHWVHCSLKSGVLGFVARESGRVVSVTFVGLCSTDRSRSVQGFVDDRPQLIVTPQAKMKEDGNKSVCFYLIIVFFDTNKNSLLFSSTYLSSQLWRSWWSLASNRTSHIGSSTSQGSYMEESYFLHIHHNQQVASAISAYRCKAVQRYRPSVSMVPLTICEPVCGCCGNVGDI